MQIYVDRRAEEEMERRNTKWPSRDSMPSFPATIQWTGQSLGHEMSVSEPYLSNAPA